MTLTHDRQITIAVGSSRKSVKWVNRTMMLSDLWDRLAQPAMGAETLREYYALKKSEQDDLKDVGGYVGGELSGPRRKAQNVLGRDLITLDLDNIPSGSTEDVVSRVAAFGTGYCIYSTRKHQPTKPRLRVLMPLDRTVTVEEYEAIARKVAEHIGLELMDSTTYEAVRMMYYPSVCADGEYIYRVGDGPLVSADTVLGSYADWHDVSSWPALPGEAAVVKAKTKQGDPESKPGIVGAFCRCYDIYRAMDELLPDVYSACDTAEDRYTYVDGSTSGGAVVYDHGQFLFSHHATDPCSGQLVNAFDMVRLHKYADLDDDAKPGCPVVKMPSYQAMCKYASGLDEVAGLMLKERIGKAELDFGGADAGNVADSRDDMSRVDSEVGDKTSPTVPDDDDSWMLSLKRNPQTQAIVQSIDNCILILEHDERLVGKFALNRFTSRGEVLGEVPWRVGEERRLWGDADNSGLYWYMEAKYGITSTRCVDNALAVHAQNHSFNDVQNYVYGLMGKWDGVPRLDTLFIDYLGAEDTEYTRAVTRKSFVAAVKRAMEPGCKFDNMLILAGPQGIGKSTILDRMSKGWFNDSIRTFEGKEASELIQGVWIVEISELDAFRKTDVSRIKMFLSQRFDRFRAAYGRNVQEIPRSCVFFGTTNDAEGFLRDQTGNRRFWPVDTMVVPPKHKVWSDFTADVADQVWAEAITRWQFGEDVGLDSKLLEAAKVVQDEHMEVDARSGMIEEFLSRKIPADWKNWPLERRRLFWAGAADIPEDQLIERDAVCALEIWCECFGGRIGELRQTDTRCFNAIVGRVPGWVITKSQVYRCPDYGKQKVCRRVM